MIAGAYPQLARIWLGIALLAATGCRGAWRDESAPSDGPYLQPFATEIEYPDVEAVLSEEISSSQTPRALENPSQLEPFDLTLEQAVRLALYNNEVLRSLGATVVQAASGQTVYDPALTESDPSGGVEAALSAFDAQFTTNAFWRHNERPIIQIIPGLFLPAIAAANSNNSTITAELSKTTATGSRFAVRHHINYNRNNNDSSQFSSTYAIDYEAEWRQPLLQGAGLEFNRIAGPNGQPGGSNGVLLARINSDISLADFEAGIIAMVADVERAYWELYFAYRDLETKIKARESALTTWRNIAERLRLGGIGGAAARIATPENEAQSRAQYYTFEAQVQDALAGDGGLYAREEQLRLLLGMPPNDGRLIRPKADPLLAPVIFDWHAVLDEAFYRRVELRRQRWQVKRRQMELLAARNHLLPRLDAVALYRWYGFGDHLSGPRRAASVDKNAYQLLTSGDFQEWQLGVEFSVPIGYRRAAAGLRNAELRLARENAVMREQELRVSHELSGSIRGVLRALKLIQTNFNRRVASQYEVDAIRATYDQGRVGIEVYLQAQQRLADANSAYFRSVVDYNLAISGVHQRKGSLLGYNGVALAESPWSDRAHDDASRRSRHFHRRRHNWRTLPRPISAGAYREPTAAEQSNQFVQPAEELVLPEPDPREARPAPRE